MTRRVFAGSFTQQEPLPEAAIAAAMAVLGHGRLHRYNLAPGEVGEVAALEEDFADLTGARYALAVASGGYAMACALRALGVGTGVRVLSNGFTLAPVPGAIASVGAEPVFVETTEALTIDIDDLAAKAAASGARVLLLSHMRGHMCDMDKLMAVCRALDLQVIEDCAHTMGATWDGVPTGRHGIIGCYSTQTYKHVNSGEGGFLISDDADAMARAIMLSGSYMLYARHRAAPPADRFDKIKLDTPNISGRMDNLRAAILRPQLPELPRQVARWNTLYARVDAILSGAPGVATILRDPREGFVGSSVQFRLPGASPHAIRGILDGCAARGVELKWFGADQPVGFTSRYDSWRYAPPQRLPRTDAILADLIDMRLPLTFSAHDASLIAEIIAEEVQAALPAVAQ